MDTGVVYFGSRDLRHVRADLADMAARRCSFVIHLLTEEDIAFNGQALAEIGRATRDLGLQMWAAPAGVCGLFGGDAFSRFLLEHPESWQVASDGRAVPAACPRDPAAREYLHAWIARAADIGAQALAWSSPRFWADAAVPNEVWSCHCPLCQDAYRDRFHKRMPAAFDEEVRVFREETLLALLSDLNRTGRRAGQRNALVLEPAEFGAFGFFEADRRWAATLNRRRAARGLSALEGIPAGLRYAGLTDWEAAACLPALDIFGAAPYWYEHPVAPEAYVEAVVGRALRAARRASDLTRHPLRTQAWFQGFAVPAGRERELFGAVQRAARMGVSYAAAWSYQGGAGRSASRSEHPEVVWRVLGEAFRSVRRR